ncbi:hypothetical protein DAPPUDRAFT_102749 [Daphnia pulex]|uniref:Uncharacterized protein n=1 Tax=Daphnia pulex TaxID=6669 RepID=E9GHE2_DAPPU|nr:hypothetical protein DAPPUDRAFT_102749 [Daphnia pulex]|eukprot:EFX81178.1 hypothetical protein DAPPUDRAFT_102749 [Daphnia pulex]
MQDAMMMNCLQNETVNECVILLDYKMKFEPVYFREKTVDHYGKRGISWHGAMITFYTVVAVDGVHTAVQNRYYMDHVVENESKQDITSVISILEAVIIGLKKLFPRLTTIYLQSDNASCYQNTMLLVLIPYLAFTYSLCIRRCIHTETQDGKSVLDAHFARCTQKVYEYCKEDSGKGCNRLRNGRNKAEKAMKRKNDVFFTQIDWPHRNEMPTSSNNEESYRNMPCFSIQGFEYSGIGNPTSYIVNPAEETIFIDNDSLNDLSDGSITESEDDLDSECIEELEIMQSGADFTTEIISSIERESSSNSDYSEEGWAKRPKNGLMYGPKHVQSYRADIYELYKLGEEEKKNKRSPAQMREALQMKYPEEFCLPSENDIRVEINRLQTKKKSPQAISRVEKTTDVYREYIRNLAKNNCQLKPKEAVKLITENFPRKDNPKLPSDSLLSRIFSYQKRCVTMQKKDCNQISNSQK